MSREFGVLLLANWRKQTSYSQALGDWVFASPFRPGQKPYWPDAVLKRHVYPAAERAGITKRIGWHRLPKDSCNSVAPVFGCIRKDNAGTSATLFAS